MGEDNIFEVPFGKIASATVCARCGTPLIGKIIYHKVLPEYLGGDSSQDNLVSVCERCDSIPFSVDIRGSYPYITGDNCSRIMAYIDNHIGKSPAKCSVCGGVADKHLVLNGRLLDVCVGCHDKVLSLFKYVRVNEVLCTSAHLGSEFSGSSFDVFEDSAADAGDWDDSLLSDEESDNLV